MGCPEPKRRRRVCWVGRGHVQDDVLLHEGEMLLKRSRSGRTRTGGCKWPLAGRRRGWHVGTVARTICIGSGRPLLGRALRLTARILGRGSWMRRVLVRRVPLLSRRWAWRRARTIWRWRRIERIQGAFLLPPLRWVARKARHIRAAGVSGQSAVPVGHACSKTDSLPGRDAFPDQLHADVCRVALGLVASRLARRCSHNQNTRR